MSQPAERVAQGAWRLWLALPAGIQDLRDELIAFVAAVADGRIAPPIRRSRHACTFRTPFALRAGPPITLYVKVIEPPGRIRRVKQLFRGGPSGHAARVTAALTADGMHAPPVWVHGRDIVLGREILVTLQAEGKGPLQTLAGLAGAIAAKRNVLRALGAEVAHMHRLGYIHGDLTPFNIFIARAETPRFILLDHERTRRAFVIGRTRRQLRNLVQLGRFNLPGVSRADRLRTLGAYVAVMNPREPRMLKRRVNAMLLRRIWRDGGLAEIRDASPALLRPAGGPEARI